MKQHRGSRQIIYGSIASLSAANILSQEVRAILVQGLRWEPSRHVMMIRNSQDGSWQLWPGDTTEGEPLITFTPYKRSSQPAGWRFAHSL